MIEYLLIGIDIEMFRMCGIFLLSEFAEVVDKHTHCKWKPIEKAPSLDKFRTYTLSSENKAWTWSDQGKPWLGNTLSNKYLQDLDLQCKI